MTKQALFKQFMDHKVQTEVMTLHIQLSADREEKMVDVSYKGLEDVVKIPAFTLKAEVYKVVGKDYIHLYNIDFGSLCTRAGEIRYIVSRLCRKELSSIEELIRIMNGVAEKHRDKFQQEAISKLLKQIGFYDRNPFDQEERQRFIDMGLIEEKEDVLL